MAQLIVAGNATPSQVLTGNTFSAGSQTGVSGTMANNGAVAITPSASSQSITAGYHNGSGSVAAVTFTAGNVLTGTTIAGTAGTMANRGATNFTPSTVNQTILAGYHNGSGVVSGDANLVAAKILSGVSIFGVAGSVTARQYATGSVANTSSTVNFLDQANSPTAWYYLAISGLTFTPTLIVCNNSTNNCTTTYVSGADLNSGTYNVPITTSTGGNQSQYYQLDGTSAYVNSTSFRLPVTIASVTINWWAFG